ncbi:MAG: hypothetical protein ACRDL8_06880 [Solirubrobacteraceae bacterium]
MPASSFGNGPALDYLVLLVVLPTTAAAGGWLFADRLAWGGVALVRR